MKNATDELVELLEESNDRLRSVASEKDPTVREHLELRIMEIRNLLSITLHYDAHPPQIKDIPDYLRASKNVADRIRELHKDKLATGSHVIYLKS